MGKSNSSRDLCQVDGRYRRTLGKFKNSSGKIAPKKFLLGTDRRLAELANVRLEQLWHDVVVSTKLEDQERASVYKKWLLCGRITLDEATPFLLRREAIWTEEALGFAEVIRKGESQIVVEWPDYEEMTDRSYVQHLANLKSRYPSLAFVPGDVAAFKDGQRELKAVAETHAMRALSISNAAAVPVPKGMGQALYEALDGFIRWIKETKLRGGKLTQWGKVLCEQVDRLKNSTADMPLDQVDYNALERIKTYWAARPASKQSGNPIALDTVRTQLNAARMFVKWLHKNPLWKWRKPDDWEDALKLDLSSLMSDDEVASLKDGVSTFTTQELAILYQYATDRERVLLLLGLNCAFARAECVGLRLDELFLEETPPMIRRIRRKSRVYGEFTLWAETMQALTWVATERAKAEPEGNRLVLLSEKGCPYGQTRVANQWNRLLDRVQLDDPKFRRLPFKFLRKTAAQLVRQVSDGETAAVFLCHGQPVKSDNLSDVYSRRDFQKVRIALVQVRQELAGVFNGQGQEFREPRKRGGSNLSVAKQMLIEKLFKAGYDAEKIAEEAGVSRATAFRRVKSLRAAKNELPDVSE